jgi:esterase/lipase superfamily enzyme
MLRLSALCVLAMWLGLSQLEPAAASEPAPGEARGLRVWSQAQQAIEHAADEVEASRQAISKRVKNSNPVRKQAHSPAPARRQEPAEATMPAPRVTRKGDKKHQPQHPSDEHEHEDAGRRAEPTVDAASPSRQQLTAALDTLGVQSPYDLSGSGRYLVATERGGIGLALCDLHAPRRVHRLKNSNHGYSLVAISPDARWIVAVREDDADQIDLWRADNGHHVRVLKVAGGPKEKLEFIAGGSQLRVTSQGGAGVVLAIPSGAQTGGSGIAGGRGSFPGLGAMPRGSATPAIRPEEMSSDESTSDAMRSDESGSDEPSAEQRVEEFTSQGAEAPSPSIAMPASPPSAIAAPEPAESAAPEAPTLGSPAPQAPRATVRSMPRMAPSARPQAAEPRMAEPSVAAPEETFELAPAAPVPRDIAPPRSPRATGSAAPQMPAPPPVVAAPSPDSFPRDEPSTAAPAPTAKPPATASAAPRAAMRREPVEEAPSTTFGHVGSALPQGAGPDLSAKSGGGGPSVPSAGGSATAQGEPTPADPSTAPREEASSAEPAAEPGAAAPEESGGSFAIVAEPEETEPSDVAAPTEASPSDAEPTDAEPDASAQPPAAPAKKDPSSVKVHYATNRNRLADADRQWLVYFQSFFSSLPAFVIYALVILAVLVFPWFGKRSWATLALVSGAILLCAMASLEAYVRSSLRDELTGELYGSRVTELSYGVCEVSVPLPKNRERGEVNRPVSVWVFQAPENPEKHFMLKHVDEYADKDTFYRSLAVEVAAGGSESALLFIHGYNVSFEDAIFRTAQLAVDLEFAGAAVTYSWPSYADPVKYTFDEQNAEVSIPALREVLEDLVSRSGAKRVHVIAHSMGNRVLAGAMRAMPQEARQRNKDTIREVVLAAPDIDSRVFKSQILPHIVENTQHCTLYASSRDRALLISHYFHNYQRLGETQPDLIVAGGMDTIDATMVDTSLLGHSYIGDAQSIVSDLHDLVVRSKRPVERLGLEALQYGGLMYWTIKPLATASDGAVRR